MCPLCPDKSPCSHRYQCNCETYYKLRFCSHLHVVIASHGNHPNGDGVTGVGHKMLMRTGNVLEQPLGVAGGLIRRKKSELLQKTRYVASNRA